MSWTEIKICGVRSERDVEVAADAGADIIGLIGIPESRRMVRAEDARELARQARTLGMLAAGVVRASELAYLDTKHLDIVQVVGDPHQIELVPGLPRVHVVVPVVPGFEEDVCMPDIGIPHFDTASPIGGGTGQRFRVDRLAEALGLKTIEQSFIAGGLSPRNVGAVIGRYAPRGVDVASGVERAGRLDPVLVQEFVQEVRHAQR